MVLNKKCYEIKMIVYRFLIIFLDDYEIWIGS
jgi:hypothetical protein